MLVIVSSQDTFSSIKDILSITNETKILSIPYKSTTFYIYICS